MRQEIPEYVDEFPIVNANPATIEDVMKRLLSDREEIKQIGQKNREFAVKWHSAKAGSRRLDRTIKIC